MASHAVNEGGAGVDMGRNINQSEAPARMLRAVASAVHDGFGPAHAYETFREFWRTPLEAVR